MGRCISSSLSAANEPISHPNSLDSTRDRPRSYRGMRNCDWPVPTVTLTVRLRTKRKEPTLCECFVESILNMDGCTDIDAYDLSRRSWNHVLLQFIIRHLDVTNIQPFNLTRICSGGCRDSAVPRKRRTCRYSCEEGCSGRSHRFSHRFRRREPVRMRNFIHFQFIRPCHVRLVVVANREC